MKSNINFNCEDIINALEDYAKKKGNLNNNETLDTINFNYDNDNNVISIDGITK